MPILSDTVKEFINVAGLATKIKALEAELAVLKTLQSSLGAKTPGRKRGPKPGPKAKAKGKRTTKGAIGEFILKLLSKKGDEGAHVNEIAKALKNKPANITAWFYGTGKKVKGIKRVKPNTFAYKGE
jgi:hypothetical protein